MAEIIKLHVAQKKYRNAESEQRAQENRARYGRTKADRNSEKALKEKRNRDLDAHRLHAEIEP